MNIVALGAKKRKSYVNNIALDPYAGSRIHGSNGMD